MSEHEKNDLTEPGTRICECGVPLPVAHFCAAMNHCWVSYNAETARKSLRISDFIQRAERAEHEITRLHSLMREQAEETTDSLMRAIRADRGAIAEFILSCRQGGAMTPVVQVFDVLASKIRAGEHLPALPTQATEPRR